MRGVIMDSIVKTGSYTYKEKEYNFNFYTDINVLTKSAFVTGVTDVLVTEKHYNAVIRNVVLEYQILNVFTDIFAEEEIRNSLYVDEGSDFDLNKLEDFMRDTQVANIVMANVKEGLIDELIEAVDKDIEYKTGIHRNPIGEAVAGLLGTLEQRVKDIDIDGLMGFAEAFKGISGDDMTPEKLWDAYSKSEAFKRVIESKEKIDKADKKQSDKIVSLVEEVMKQPKKRGRKPKAKKEETAVEDKNVKDE
jgi:hypothetical protein